MHCKATLRKIVFLIENEIHEDFFRLHQLLPIMTGIKIALTSQTQFWFKCFSSDAELSSFSSLVLLEHQKQVISHEPDCVCAVRAGFYK